MQKYPNTPRKMITFLTDALRAIQQYWGLPHTMIKLSVPVNALESEVSGILNATLKTGVWATNPGDAEKEWESWMESTRLHAAKKALDEETK